MTLPTHPSLASLRRARPAPPILTSASRSDRLAFVAGTAAAPYTLDPCARLLAGAEVIMEPRTSLQPDSLTFKRELFTPNLRRLFALAGESAHWRAWVRTAGGVSAPLGPHSS